MPNNKVKLIQKKKKSAKKVAKLPEIVKTKVVKKKVVNPLIESKPRNFAIGQDIQPKRDLTRFVKWPQYIVRQRNKAVLRRRLKMPAVVNQFKQGLDKANTKVLLKMLTKYRPESAEERAAKLKLRGAERVEGKAETVPSDKASVVKSGVREVTALVESKRAQLVIVAHDVEPLEIVLHLPALCRKMDVPYCIVRGKAVLGEVVRQKTCAALALVTVNSEDKAVFSKLVEVVRNNFNNRGEEIRKHIGGGEMGMKAQAKQLKLRKIQEKDIALKMA